MSGVEYQVLDNTGYPDLNSDSHNASAVFDMYSPSVDNLKPVGEFNTARIIVDNGHVVTYRNIKIKNYDDTGIEQVN